MKKTISLIMAVMLVVSMFAMINVSAADAVVYVDGTKEANGTGTKDSPFNNIVDAFAAVGETGGTITIIGDVDGFKKLTTKKTTTDEEGNVVETDEYETLQINLPVAKKRVTVTSDGGALVFTNTGSVYFNHFGKVTYSNAKVDLGSQSGQRVYLCAYNGSFVMESSTQITGGTGHYMLCNGVVEWNNPFALAHVFANNWTGCKGVVNAPTVFIIGESGKIGTIWNGGASSSLVYDSIYILKDSATLNRLAGAGQTKLASESTIYFEPRNGHIPATLDTAGTNGGSVKALKSIGAEVTGYTKVDASWNATEANENAALFNNVTKEYKVTSAANALVNVAKVDEDINLYAIVDGAAVQIPAYATTNDGTWFCTVEGATNYVFADSVKEAQKPTEGEGGSASETGDPIALVVVFAVVSLAGAVVFKKVR